MMPSPIRAADDLFIICAAFRYALGRSSYAPGLVADWIEARKSQITEELRLQIANEVRAEIARRGESLPYSDRWLALAVPLASEGQTAQ